MTERILCWKVCMRNRYQLADYAYCMAAGEACINAHLKYYRETDLDLVKVMCDGYFPWPFREKIPEG